MWNYPASVRVDDDATLLFVSNRTFRPSVWRTPRLRSSLAGKLGPRSGAWLELSRNFLLPPVRHGLASFLLRLLRRKAKRTSEGVEMTLPVQQPGTRVTDWHRTGTRFRNLSRLQGKDAEK